MERTYARQPCTRAKKQRLPANFDKTSICDLRLEPMATPQLLNDVISLLLLLAPSAALLSLVLAGITLRREGGTTFAIGGGFTKWMFWAVVFLTLQPLLTWFSSFGITVPLPSGGIGTSWLASIQSDIASVCHQLCRGANRAHACRVLRLARDSGHGGR